MPIISSAKLLPLLYILGMYHLGPENVKSNLFLSRCPHLLWLLLLLFYACNYGVEKVVILNALGAILNTHIHTYVHLILVFLSSILALTMSWIMFWADMLTQPLCCTTRELILVLPPASWGS